MNSLDLALARLREDAGANLRAIEDLTKFRANSRFFCVHENDPKRFAYLLVSGHPSTAGRSPTVILGGSAASAIALMQHLPEGPYTIVETPQEFVKVLEGKMPGQAEIFCERRMELSPAKFMPASSSRVRRLVETDDVSLADFNGAPPQAAAGMRDWIRGAASLLGIFDDSKLIAMGSSFCTIPEGWSLVGIKTRDEHRRKGLAAEVTSALCSAAFNEVSAVELTVLSDNGPAIALYQKLGFELKEERVWIDCGSGAKPFF
jgi:ribosomal protein S18 acetylase RimI-like enzyme